MSGEGVRDPLRVSFIMEQHLGHATYAANLRREIAGHPHLDDRWHEVNYTTDSWWTRRLPDAVRGALRGRVEVARAVAGPAPDVTVFNTQVPATIGPRRARRRPYVLCTDVTPKQQDGLATSYGHRPDRFRLERVLKHAWNVRVARGAARHAPWSEWVAGSLTDDYGVESSRIEVIAPGVDLTRWSPSADRVWEGPLRVLMVAGDFQRKGGDTLLSAIEGLGPDEITLDVVTRSPLPADDRVHAHYGLSPGDEALIERFRRAHVLVLPSRGETFGIAAIEAAAAGLPAIVSDVGGLPETIVAGETGHRVVPGDTAGLRRALDHLRHDRTAARTMGEQARRLAERRFDARANAERLVELIHVAAGVSREDASPGSGRGRP